MDSGSEDADATAETKIVSIEESGEGTYSVWDPQEAIHLRTQHRIVGTFEGSLPKFTHQNIQLCMPMTLPREAVSLLLKLGFAKLVKLTSANHFPQASTSKQYENGQKCSFSIQRLKLAEAQIATKLEHAEKIAKGRKAKRIKIDHFHKHWQGAEMDQTGNVSKSCSKNRDSSTIVKTTQISTSSPLLNFSQESLNEQLPRSNNSGKFEPNGMSERNDFKCIDDAYKSPKSNSNTGGLSMPSSKSRLLRITEKDLEDVTVTRQEINAVLKEIKRKPSDNEGIEVINSSELHEEIPHMCVYPQDPLYDEINGPSFRLSLSEDQDLRSKVYEELWKQGYYLSGGFKFGCDFLAYPGDPIIFHAAYMVICLKEKETFSAQKLESWNRLASQVKKTLLFAYLSEEERVIKFMSSNWAKNLKIF